MFDLDTVHIDEILKKAIEMKASDVHLPVGKPPVFRINGRMVDQGNVDMKQEHTDRLMRQTMNKVSEEKFNEDWEVDYSYAITAKIDTPDPMEYRFRVNSFIQKGYTSGVMRLIPYKIPTLEQLNMPEALSRLVNLPRGLVLVTGPTGSGKSTTLAAVINKINETRETHIITMEDPIEFVHHHKKSVIVQREIGQDTQSFARALKSALRQDPDIILLGEMRDLETISMAVTLAETGHLVFATLHTTSAAQTIDRIIDVFPPEQQEQIRIQLANNLEAICAQTLLRTPDGKGRVAATEILLKTAAGSANIRNGKSVALNDVMQTNGRMGMHTLEQDLIEKIRQQKITIDTAYEASSHPEVLQQMLKRMKLA